MKCVKCGKKLLLDKEELELLKKLGYWETLLCLSCAGKTGG